ncbi:hypothetical protein ACFQYP_00360 [Nonomuraea antimicrobica]|uniref:hypothetical protein n=1 Tax=Nonomuraea antimicrobica TaxID=561173 RepID=UPI0031EF3DEE
MADQLVRRGVHEGVQTLEDDLRTWKDRWNADPKPFVWTRWPRKKSVEIWTMSRTMPEPDFVQR